MEFIFVIISVVYFIWIIGNCIKWILIWQKHLYSPSNVVKYLIETPKGKKIIFSPLLFSKWILLFSYGFIVFNTYYLPIYQNIVVALYLFQGLLILQALRKTNINSLRFRMRSVFTVLIPLFFLSLLFAIPLVEPLVWMLVIDLLTPVLIAFFAITLS